MIKPLIVSAITTLFFPAATPNLEDSLAQLQSKWIQGCLEAGFSTEMETYCVEQAGKASRRLRKRFIPVRHPHLDTLIRYSISSCADHLRQKARASKHPTSVAEAMNVFGELTQCTIFVYEAMLETAGGEDAFIEKMNNASDKKEV